MTKEHPRPLRVDGTLPFATPRRWGFSVSEWALLGSHPSSSSSYLRSSVARSPFGWVAVATTG
jgi:hypothetical protein